MNWVLETQFELIFLLPFTGGKKCLKKNPDIINYIITTFLLYFLRYSLPKYVRGISKEKVCHG